MTCRALRTWSSLAPFAPMATFSAIDPANRNPSCGTTQILLRNDDSVAWRRSTPPRRMDPSVGSYSRAISLASVDFPAPVGPTNATRSPCRITSSTPCSTGFVPS